RPKYSSPPPRLPARPSTPLLPPTFRCRQPPIRLRRPIPLQMSGKPAWHVTGASARGAVHARAQRPNQDAIAWHAPQGPDDSLVLTVADGHGSPRYLRSHRGAKLAVTLAVEIL